MRHLVLFVVISSLVVAFLCCQQVAASKLVIKISNINNNNDEKLEERIIHLPAPTLITSILTSFLPTEVSYDDNDQPIGGDPFLHIGFVAALSLIVIFVVFGIVPILLSCTALWVCKCCLYPPAGLLSEQEEEEMDESNFMNMPRVDLDSGWYTRIQNRLFDVTFVDCAIILFWVVTWLFRKLTCGIFDSIFILRITRFQVRRMVIGNRKLDMDISDACCSIPFYNFLNNACNVYTCGLWRALGLTHRFYLSKIDKRIFFTPVGEVLDMDRRIVWHNYSNNQSFKWFSIYCGTSTELTYWFLKLLNVSTLFFFSPFIEAWYIRQKMLFAKFGGRGTFAVYNNGRLESFVNKSPNTLSFISYLDGCSLLIRIWMFRLANIFTFGIFGCIFGQSFILSFIDEHLSMLVV